MTFCKTTIYLLFPLIFAVCVASDIKNNLIFLHNFFHRNAPFEFEYNFDGVNVTSEYFNLIKSGQSLGYDFYNEWDNIVRSVDSKANNVQCMEQLTALVLGFGNNDMVAYKYFDSWGKFPAGILKGHLSEFGNFDECVDINKFLTANNQLIGKYCFAQISIGKLVTGSPIAALFPLRIAICMPAACDPKEFDVFLRLFLKTLFGLNVGSNSTIVDGNSCKLREKEPFQATSWVAVAVLSILGAAMLFSSLYDFFYKTLGIEQHPILNAFSVQRNMGQLLRIDPNTKSANVIPCLNGIRCLSLVWVMIAHSLTYTLILPHINTFEVLPWGRTAFSMIFQQGAYAVDSFLFLSGLLVAFIALRDMQRNNGKINVPMMYIHRILRLTPMLALAILVYTAFYRHMANGPVWDQFNQFTNNCPKSWWITLLFVQNYVRAEQMCLDHAWYLSVDTQLYLISPILLLILFKWKRKGFIFVALLVLLSTVWLFTLIVVNKYMFHTAGLGLPVGNSVLKTYYPTHLHAAPWLVGLLFGYYMHHNKHKRMLLPKWVVLFGWLICFAVIATVIFAFFPQAQVNAKPITPLEEAFYKSLGRVAWPLVLCWIVLAGVNGYGGLINEFLSCPLWQPFARLSYCMYLWHVFIEGFNAGRVKTNTYFSNYDMLLRFWSDYGWTVLFSTVMYLAFEAPLLNLEKHLLPKSNTKKTKTVKVTSSEELEAAQQPVDVTATVDITNLTILTNLDNVN